MKGTEHFKEIIKGYLDQRAKEDELFRAKYETTTRTIDDVVTFILHEVKNSGCCGFSSEEILVVNRHIELTEEEKAEQRALALKRYQDEELRKIQVRNARPKAHKPQTDSQPTLSLFDNF